MSSALLEVCLSGIWAYVTFVNESMEDLELWLSIYPKHTDQEGIQLVVKVLEEVAPNDTGAVRYFEE